MKKYLGPLFILILSFWAVAPLFHSGFFPMHDDEQIARLYQLHLALTSGQFPPRWIPDLGFGFGYPFYNFYPPLVYYLGEIFHLLGFSLIISTKIVMALGFLLSGIFMYLLAKEFFGKIGGFVAAIFYLYAPYHSVDLYVRGALAEFYSFVFLPAVFWSTLKLFKEKNIKWIIINSLFLSFFLLSHNLMILPFLPFYLAFLIFLFWKEKEKKKVFLFLGFSGLLFLGLTAYFWLPAILERKYTLVDEILTRELASYKVHFVYLRQFLSSSWGYGGSIPGPEDGLSFEIGKLHLVAAFSAGILGFYLFLRKKKEWKIFLFAFLSFLFSLFMVSFHSQFIWDHLQPLWYLQFPWRLLLFSGFFSSILAGGLISFFANKMQKSFLRYLMISLPIVAVILLNKDYFAPLKYLDISDKNYTSKNELHWRVSKMSWEFVPKGVATTLSDIKTTQMAITKTELPKDLFKAEKGIDVLVEKDLVQYKKLKIKGKGGILAVNTYNFPGWEVTLDKQKVLINDYNKFKLITFSVPAGTHEIIVQFKNTPIRTIGNFLTIGSFLVLLIFSFKTKNVKNKS